MKKLSIFELQERQIARLMKKCDEDQRYGLRLIVKGIWNIEDVSSHDYSIMVFKNGKKHNGYGLRKEIFEKYVIDNRFSVEGTPISCIVDYIPTYIRENK